MTQKKNSRSCHQRFTSSRENNINIREWEYLQDLVFEKTDGFIFRYNKEQKLFSSVAFLLLNQLALPILSFHFWINLNWRQHLCLYNLVGKQVPIFISIFPIKQDGRIFRCKRLMKQKSFSPTIGSIISWSELHLRLNWDFELGLSFAVKKISETDSSTLMLMVSGDISSLKNKADDGTSSWTWWNGKHQDSWITLCCSTSRRLPLSFEMKRQLKRKSPARIKLMKASA